MSRLKIAFAICLAAISPSTFAALRLFFSTVGVPNQAPLPPEMTPIPRTNPVVGAGARLYVWAEMIAPPESQNWSAVDFDVHVEGGHVSSRVLYNYVHEIDDLGDYYIRWYTLQFAGPSPRNVANLVIGAGVSNSADAAWYDQQSEVGVLGVNTPAARELPKATLLGYVDVLLNSGAARADVYLQVGEFGITRRGGTQPAIVDGPIGDDPIYFGIGDENPTVHGASFGRGSGRPDAVIWSTTSIGACCLPGGACEARAAFDCAAAGGQFGGAGTVCGSCAAACCVGDACTLTDAAMCAAGGGYFAGIGSTCNSDTCRQACCLSAGVCSMLTLTQCAAAGGSALGGGAKCVARPCPGSPCDGPPLLHGDANCDGAVNNFDIDPMVAGLVFSTSPTAPQIYLLSGATAECWARRRCWGDTNRDGLLNSFDIDPYVACATNTPPFRIGCRQLLRGDANCDGIVNNLDIDFFVMALVNYAQFPGAPWLAAGGTFECWEQWRYWGDVDGSGPDTTPLRFDIDAMTACLLNPPPPGEGCNIGH